MAHLELPEQPAAPILELHGQRKLFTVPYGLKALLELMTREVLRANPPNIYEFLAKLIENELEERELKEKAGGPRHSWEWRRWSWDGSSILSEEELKSFLADYKISVETAQHLATIIQATYRGFMTRKKVHQKQEEHEHRRASLWDEWRHDGNFFVSGKDVLDILSYYGISLFEANAFATKIQSVYRGHHQRSSLAKTDPELAAHLDALGITHEEANKHAIVIQSAFRGYRVRKQTRLDSEEESEWDAEWAGEDEDAELQEALANEARRLSKLNKLNKTVSEMELEIDEEDVEMHEAASKIQAGFRGFLARQKVKRMKEDKDMEESEEEESEMEVNEEEVEFMNADPAQDNQFNPPPAVQTEEEKIKYEAYFPGGYEAKYNFKDENGVEIPPKFTHEHFGEIDPLAIKQKFSDAKFRDKMSYMLKDLDEAKKERLKERSANQKPGNQISGQNVARSEINQGQYAQSQRGSLPGASGVLEGTDYIPPGGQRLSGASEFGQPPPAMFGGEKRLSGASAIDQPPASMIGDEKRLSGASGMGQPPASVAGSGKRLSGASENGQPPPSMAGGSAVGKPPPSMAGGSAVGQPPPSVAGSGASGKPPPSMAGGSAVGQPPPSIAGGKRLSGASIMGQPPPSVAGSGAAGKPPPSIAGTSAVGKPPPSLAGASAVGQPPPSVAGASTVGKRLSGASTIKP